MRYSGTLLVVGVEDKNGNTFQGDIFSYCKKLERTLVVGGTIGRVYMEGSHIMAEVILEDEEVEEGTYFNLCIHTEMTKNKIFTEYRKVDFGKVWVSEEHADYGAQALEMVE